ncbi:MAG: hypothetical protein AAGK32_04075, partial [Actinomycetota bacterium]
MHVRSTTSRRWRRILVIAFALALVAAACGDRGEDTSGGDDGGSDTESADDGGGEAGMGDFGDLEAVCGPAEEGTGAVPDDPDETQGVDEDSIQVGTVADPGFEGRPGLNQEIFDTAEAFVAWCNEAGGINGKTLELTLYDAAINNYQPQIEAACDNEFALVGSGAVQDNLWPDVGATCGLIDVAGFSVTPEKGGVFGQEPFDSRSIQPVPNPSDRQVVAAASLLAEEFPEAITSSYILFSDLATLITQADKERQAFEQVGFEFIGDAVFLCEGDQLLPRRILDGDSLGESLLGAQILQLAGIEDFIEAG